MCLNCGCGKKNDNHGNPLNITYNRLKLVADRNGSTPKEQAANMLATLTGKITPSSPLEHDQLLVKITRVKAKKIAKYV